MRRARNRARLAAIAAAALCTALAPAAAAAAERWTPLVASVVSPPRPVPASDGRVHLAYELLLINRSFNPPARIVLRGVRAVGGGRTLASLSGRRLASVTFPFGGRAPSRVLGRGEAAYVTMDVRLPRGARVPRRLAHRLSIALRPPSRVVATSYRAAPTRVARRPATVVAPPLRGPGWVVGNGCCAELTSTGPGSCR